MQCPKCHAAASAFRLPEGVEINLCRACKGVWFDKGELARAIGTATDVPAFEQVKAAAKTTQITCPKCAGATLAELPYAPGYPTVIEMCPACFGVWLDATELAAVKQIAATFARSGVRHKPAPAAGAAAAGGVAGAAAGATGGAAGAAGGAAGAAGGAAGAAGGAAGAASGSAPAAYMGSGGISHAQSVPTSAPFTHRIGGNESQYVEIELPPGAMVMAEAGHMMYMTEGVAMETLFGSANANTSGLMGKMLGAGKRMLTGESLFITVFYNVGQRTETVAFAAPFPGHIIPLDLAAYGGELICQRDAYLCSTRDIEIGIAFQKRIFAGFFGGEGFILQKLTGDGTAFIHTGGSLIHRRLAPGEVLNVDTGCVAAFSSRVRYDVKMMGGVRNVLFSGEGLFITTLRGPGDVWLQSMPISRLAARLMAAGGVSGGSTTQRATSGGDIIGGIFDLLK